MGAVKQMLTKMGQSIQEAIVSLLEAAKRPFSPHDDDYPATGVQPFDGDSSKTRQP